MSKTQQQETLSAFAAGSDTISVTRTVKLPLQTSQQKTELVKLGIDAYQSVLSHMADHLPSYPEWEWEPMNTHMYHHAKRGLPDPPDDAPGRGFKKTIALEAQKQVAESFKSWRENGTPGDSPDGDFGGGSYLSLRNDCIEVVKHDDGGYGLKTSFISYHPVWFGITVGDYQRDFLERITDEEDSATAGSAELHLSESGDLHAHLTVTWDVETYVPADVSTSVGVDLNADPLAAAAVWDTSEESVKDVMLYSGAEFRHYREQMKRKKDQAQRDGNLKQIIDSRRDYQKYTDHVTNVASRRVVDMAAEHTPCKIQLEDLNGLRESVENPIHDWPYAEIQEKIISKAKEAGIPVVLIDPANTSNTCRKCGETNPAMRSDRDFECWECGYEVHADVNAAINIAQRKSK